MIWTRRKSHKKSPTSRQSQRPIGGFELGLIPDGKPGEDGVKALWGVDDIVAEVLRLNQLGVKVVGEVQEVGGGIKVIDILDPFGNLVGLIENPGCSISKVQ